MCPSTGPVLQGRVTPGFDRFVVLIQPGGEASHGIDSTRGRALEPGIELRRLPLADQRGKVLREVDRLGHLGLLRMERVSCWVSASVRFASRRSTSQVARRGVKGWHDGSATAGRGCRGRRCPGGRPWACRKRRA